MHPYQNKLIELILKNNMIQFGDFVLKSGKKSHFFFNAGKFNDGFLFSEVGEYYADAIMEKQIHFDVLFGPAYKGIPLVVSTAMMLWQKYQKRVAFAYNRKESKEHGEGGQIVGAELKGRVLLIDDVLTAGTALKQSAQFIQANRAQLAAALVLLNRQETIENSEETWAVRLEKELSIPIFSLITLADIMAYIEKHDEFKGMKFQF